MVYDFLAENSSLLEEIMEEYYSLRMKGHSRETALAKIYERYKAESNDEDDRPFVRVAVALALCRKKELTPEARDDALQAIELLRSSASDGGVPYSSCDLDRLIRYVSEGRTGPEAAYRARKKYDPGWRVGDTFIHPFSQSAAEQMGLSGWCIVIRKVGEYQDRKSRHMQLAYFTICSAGAIPQTDADVRALGYLRMMEHDNGWDYLGQFCLKSKRDEEMWGLQKIGCFPDAGCPDDATIENPLVSMPFFGVLHRDSQLLDYEDQVCHLIRFNGIHRST